MVQSALSGKAQFHLNNKIKHVYEGSGMEQLSLLF